MKNNERRINEKQAEYNDDCGAWDKKGKGSPTSYYHLKDNFVTVIKYNKTQNLFFNLKRLLMDPQPNSNAILIIQRYYLKLKLDNQYERRITRIIVAPSELISNVNYGIVEYKWIFPGHSSHGLTRNVDTMYIRTLSHVMNQISEMSKNDAPRSV